MDLQESAPASGAGEAPRRDRRPLTRRQFLASAAGGAVALGLAGFVGYEWPRSDHRSEQSALSEQGREAASQVQYFLTRPDLQPPSVRVTRTATADFANSPRYIFLAARHLNGAPSQQGLMLIDRTGELVWFQPLKIDSPFDFNAQYYRGEPRLTWWQGEIVDGHGIGTDMMADSSYRSVGTIPVGDHLRADLHELHLTSTGSALVTAYDETTADLSSRGGPRRGKVFGCHAQEIDLATGKVLFDWNSLSSVGVEESYLGLPRAKNAPYDYFHINSIAEAPDGNLLISARNTWAVYKIDRSNGRVIWRMNGKKSDFVMGPHTLFYWQHDARPVGRSSMSLFDDGGTPVKEPRSRAILLAVDERAMQVNLQRAYVYPSGFLAANQGSMQVLSDGRVFVGWGNQPYFSEFAPDGSLLLDGELPPGIRSYRAFTHDWSGHPAEPPRIAIRPDSAGGTLVYASWNGATEVQTWVVLAGPDGRHLATTGSQQRTGFETMIAVNDQGPAFCVVALDAARKELGRSAIAT